MDPQLFNMPGTILWFAPFYNRTGFGGDARSAVSALHRAGVPIRIVPVDNVELGIDDCDMELIKSLESTVLIPPITVIISHVPNKIWLTIKLPEPNLKILATTVFDCNAEESRPPDEMLDVCRKMDQIWIMTEKERDAFIANGFPPDMVKVVHWPHGWVDNPMIPMQTPETLCSPKPFRFLSISLFLPRRRWDTLIRAYFEEFKNDENVELYLRVNYPSWHPIPGKPQKELFEIVNSLRHKTGSTLPIIIDEKLGTRTDILQLIDSCNTYISTDTAVTAPVTESRVRKRMVVIPLSFGSGAEDSYIAIPSDPKMRTLLTPDMRLYQPNHSEGSFLPLLKVMDVRNSMRKAFSLSPEERRRMCEKIALIKGPRETISHILQSINTGWKYKNAQIKKEENDNKSNTILWEGSQYVYTSLSLVNREITSRLLHRGRKISLLPLEADQFVPLPDDPIAINKKFFNKFTEAEITIRHQWPPNLVPPAKGHWVNMQPWEFGSLPKEWVRVFKTQVDEMWAYSNYVKQVYVDSGVLADRVFVIPLGVDTKKFVPSARPYKLKTRKKFKFLFVGGTIFRKGIDVLLKAYGETFTAMDDVCLVIKDMGGDSFYKGQLAKETIAEIRNTRSAPEIEYIDKNLEEKGLIGLYTACTILVHPYRGEGFGLPVLEAMACGLPVIVTQGGSTDDFCENDFSFKIKSERMYFDEKKIGDMETVDSPWLLNPDKNDLIQKMKYVCANAGVLKEMGAKAAAHAKNHYSWDTVTTLVEERLREVAKKEIIRFTVPDPYTEFMFHMSGMQSDIEKNNVSGSFDHLLAAMEAHKKIGDTSRVNIPYTTLLNIAGNITCAMNAFDRSLHYFEELLHADPNSSEACYGLGMVFNKRQAFNESKTMLEWAIRNDSRNVKASALLQAVNLNLGLAADHFSSLDGANDNGL